MSSDLDKHQLWNMKKEREDTERKIRNKIITLHALTMFDENVSWPKMTRITGKTSNETSKVFDREWL